MFKERHGCASFVSIHMKTGVSLLQKFIRNYTFYSPIQKGKYRLSDLAIRLSRKSPDEITVRTADGRELLIDIAKGSYRYLYFTGEYETAISNLLRRIIAPGDICLDIGANIGWYTTLFQKLVGNEGEVHAFEPVPPIFDRLKHNIKVNEPPKNVRLNNFALGDTETTVDLHIFADLPDGHASIATFDHKEFEVFPSRMTTLDSYITANGIENVNLIKIDIEGAELMMLKGASKLFSQNQLPVLEIEMALATTSGFNYLPNDIIKYIRHQADYVFFAIDERTSKLREIKGFDSEDIGANVLCLPRNFDESRVSDWLS